MTAVDRVDGCKPELGDSSDDGDVSEWEVGIPVRDMIGQLLWRIVSLLDAHWSTTASHVIEPTCHYDVIDIVFIMSLVLCLLS